MLFLYYHWRLLFYFKGLQGRRDRGQRLQVNGSQNKNDSICSATEEVKGIMVGVVTELLYISALFHREYLLTAVQGK